MELLDVNVLINASRQESADHLRFRDWIDELLRTSRPFALTDLVAAGFIRMSTHARIFHDPYTTGEALAVIQDLRSRSFCTWLHHSERHWVIFQDLCRAANITDNLVNDAWLAAMAIEHDCEIISADRDFGRFPGLRWRNPLTG